MSTRMHYRSFRAAIHAARLGCERQSSRFRNGECIHVCTQRDRWTGQTTFEHADDARSGNASAYPEAELSQMVGDETRCPYLTVAQLGMLVNVAAPGDQLGLHRSRALLDRP